MKLSLTELLTPIFQHIATPILRKLDAMSQQVTDLQSAIATLTSAVSATTANETALKQKLDAAIAENVSLQAQLTAAQAGAADPADATAIAQATQTVLAQAQALSDAATATAPAN